MTIVQNLPSIPEFYANKGVFITGGLGFVGKVIVEKLLRSCPDIDQIYLLARAKKGKNVQERLNDVIDSQIFDLLRNSNPKVFKKIILIEGDISKDNLGLSEADQKLFRERVNVIINSAATVRMKETLRTAVRTNLCSVRDLLKLARSCENLDALVHISTAYTNWFEIDVREVFYPTKHEPEEIIKMVEELSDAEIKKILPSLLAKHDNTYTFTKALSENFISKHSEGLPVVVTRPSIVQSTLCEPMPGWIDSWGTTMLYVMLGSKGLCRSLNVDPNYNCDIIPVDFVSNLAIAAGWKVSMEKQNLVKSEKNVPTIYNSTSGSENPIKWKDYYATTTEMARKFPIDNLLWYPNIRLVKSTHLWKVDFFITHLIPACLMDFGRVITWKKPKFIATQLLLYKSCNDVAFACVNPIVHHSKNYQKLAAVMNHGDLKNFNFDVRTINWKNFVADFYMGSRKFLWKQKSTDFIAGRKNIAKLKMTNYVVMASTVAAGLYGLNKLRKMQNERKTSNKLDQI